MPPSGASFTLLSNLSPDSRALVSGVSTHKNAGNTADSDTRAGPAGEKEYRANENATAESHPRQSSPDTSMFSCPYQSLPDSSIRPAFKLIAPAGAFAFSREANTQDVARGEGRPGLKNATYERKNTRAFATRILQGLFTPRAGRKRISKTLLRIACSTFDLEPVDSEKI